MLEEIGKRCEALMLPAFPQQSELGAMIGEAVDLAVIEFAPTDGLGRCQSVLYLPPQTAVGRELPMFGASNL